MIAPIRIGRRKDGSGDIWVDLADAAHWLMQGITRSGKSALTYAILSQCVQMPHVKIVGVDPTAILLGPHRDQTMVHTGTGDMEKVVERWADTLTIGASGQRSAHLVLRAILDRAVEDGAIAANLARRVPLPRVPHREHHRYLTAEQVQELASALGPQGDVVTLLAYTGLRWGELVGLRVEDVDLTRRRLRVVRSVTPVAGKPIEGPPKSRAGRRTVPIAGPAARVLSARLAGRDGMVPAVTSPSGGMLSVTNWRQQTKWNVTLKGLGLDGLRPHDLRHTYASLARSAGADLKLLQATMGHSSITVTAHTYADLYDNELDAVADALDRLMNPEDDSQRGPSVAAIETLPLFN